MLLLSIYIYMGTYLNISCLNTLLSPGEGFQDTETLFERRCPLQKTLPPLLNWSQTCLLLSVTFQLILSQNTNTRGFSLSLETIQRYSMTHRHRCYKLVLTTTKGADVAFASHPK